MPTIICAVIDRNDTKMLEISPTCENCNKPLPNVSSDARVCTFECTFCAACVNELLYNVCTNCGRGFEKRPSRPAARLDKYPLSTKAVYKPVDMEQFKVLLEQYVNIDASKR